MTLYVDDMKVAARPAGYQGRPGARWSHMFADTPAELLAAADALGLRRSWIQHPGTHREHFDVTNSVRERALHDLGAVSITYPHEVGNLMHRRRERCQCTTLPGCRWAEIVRSGQ